MNGLNFEITNTNKKNTSKNKLINLESHFKL